MLQRFHFMVLLGVIVVGLLGTSPNVTDAQHHCYEQCTDKPGGHVHAGNPNDPATYVCCEPGNPVPQPGICGPGSPAGSFSCPEHRVAVGPADRHSAKCLYTSSSGKTCESKTYNGELEKAITCGDEECEWEEVLGPDGNPVTGDGITKVCVAC